MMFEDEIIDAARQSVFARQGNSIMDMGNDGLSRFGRIHIFMCVDLSLRLVLNKEHGIRCLAHIVKKSADAREQCICTDKFCCLLCQIRDRKSTRLNSSHLVISYAVFC